jgi:hypothetical protein
VAALDLEELYAVYRDDGRRRPVYEPSMMVALSLYAYARGVRSAREMRSTSALGQLSLISPTPF